MSTSSKCLGKADTWAKLPQPKRYSLGVKRPRVACTPSPTPQSVANASGQQTQSNPALQKLAITLRVWWARVGNAPVKDQDLACPPQVLTVRAPLTARSVQEAVDQLAARTLDSLEDVLEDDSSDEDDDITEDDDPTAGFVVDDIEEDIPSAALFPQHLSLTDSTQPTKQ